MKTTLRYAAFAVFFALFTFPVQMYAKAPGSAASAKKAAPTTYTVNFNANGGKGKMSPQKFAVNKAAKLSANRFTRGGHVFTGWSTSKTGDAKYQNGQSVKNLAAGGKTVTLYAHWAVQSYIVAFYANGGSGSMSVQKHAYGKAANLPPSRFTRKGYSFAGWATKPQGKVAYKDKASVKNLTQDGRTIQLYAVWTANAATASLPGDEVDFSQLKWVYGGFNGASAKISPNARVKSLKASNSGVTYSWASGGCQNLGASSATDANCLACLFCYSDGKWTGGKFDWICTNNKSPSFKNIQDKYKGWSSAALSKATEYAFVIVGKDGRTRTNVIRVKSPGGSTSTSATKPATSTATTATKPATSTATTATKPATSTATTATKPATSAPSLPGDQVDFALLKWIYGGFNGVTAKISDNARIKDLKASKSGVSYSWASGGCQNLGASSESDASCIACLFCYSGGKWIGGKFDWICTNNKSPGFANITDQYKGWSGSVLSKAEEYAFVILSKDGRARTNVIRVKSPGVSTSTTSPTSTPPTSTPTTSASTTATDASSADEVNFSLLQWTYGGFKGEQAKLGAQPRISGLNVNNSGMTYSWKSGGCENLGATSGSDFSHTVACLFCYYGGKWVGGKFDWVSTSRRSRDFKNVHDGYNGWSPTAFTRAEAYAFVIVSKDGKSRSNVIRCGK